MSLLIFFGMFIVFCCCVSSINSSDLVQPNNDCTFHGFNHLLKEGNVFKILDFNGNALTSNPSDGKEPSIVTVTFWRNTPYQRWEVHHVDDGIILTPEQFDFNAITYFTENNAQAYVLWHLGRPGVNVIPIDFNLKLYFMLRNAKSKCLTAIRLDKRQEIGDTQHCQSYLKTQYWMFINLPKTSRK